MPSAGGLAGLRDRVRDREVVDARHRRDRLAPVDPVGDEHRVDEIAGRELGLADEAPQRAGGAQPAQAGLGERHRSENTPGYVRGAACGPPPAGCMHPAGPAAHAPPGSLYDVPELDPPGGHEPRLDVRIGLGELLRGVGIVGAEHDRRAVRRIAEGARHDDPVIAVDVGQVGLPVGTPALEDVVDVVV